MTFSKTLILALALVGAAALESKRGQALKSMCDSEGRNQGSSFLQRTGAVPFDGYFEVGCYEDKTDRSKWLFYAETLKKDFKEPAPVTPELCFNFCRAQANMTFFGLTSGRECYCTPYPTLTSGMGGKNGCTRVCEGDKSKICGGDPMSSVYEMHRCYDTLKDATTATKKATKLIESGDFQAHKMDMIIASMDEVGQQIDVPQIRKNVMAQTRTLAGLNKELVNRKEDASVKVTELESATASFDAGSATAEMMKDVEDAVKGLSAAVVALDASVDAMRVFFEDHDLDALLKWRGFDKKALAKKALEDRTLEKPEYSVINFMPAGVALKIGCDKKVVDGCDDFPLSYFVVEDPDETKSPGSYYQVYDPVEQKYGAGEKLTKEQWVNFAKLECVDACRMTNTCVGANMFGSSTGEEWAFTCNMKSNIKTVELGKGKKELLSSGFIFREYFGIHEKEIKFDTARFASAK